MDAEGSLLTCREEWWEGAAVEGGVPSPPPASPDPALAVPPAPGAAAPGADDLVVAMVAMLGNIVRRMVTICMLCRWIQSPGANSERRNTKIGYLTPESFFAGLLLIEARDDLMHENCNETPRRSVLGLTMGSMASIPVRGTVRGGLWREDTRRPPYEPK